MWREFDKDCSGYIEADELKVLLLCLVRVLHQNTCPRVNTHLGDAVHARHGRLSQAVKLGILDKSRNKKNT